MQAFFKPMSRVFKFKFGNFNWPTLISSYFQAESRCRAGPSLVKFSMN